MQGLQGAREDKKGGGTLKEKSGGAMLMLRDAGLALKRTRWLPIRLGEMRRGRGGVGGARAAPSSDRGCARTHRFRPPLFPSPPRSPAESRTVSRL